MAITKIQAESMNLADTYAFTGTVSGASDMMLLSSTTVSSDVSSVDYTNSVFSTTYDTYKIFINDGRLTSDNANLEIRVSYDNGSSFNGTSQYGRVIACSGTGDGNNSYISRVTNVSAGDIVLGHADSMGNASGESGNYELTVHNANSSNKKFISSIGGFMDYNGNYRMTYGIYPINNTTAISGMTIKAGSGSISGGTFLIYGVKK
jgi:hypothetical protein